MVRVREVRPSKTTTLVVFTANARKKNTSGQSSRQLEGGVIRGSVGAATMFTADSDQERKSLDGAGSAAPSLGENNSEAR